MAVWVRELTYLVGRDPEETSVSPKIARENAENDVSKVASDR